MSKVPIPEEIKGVLFASVTAFLWGFLAIGMKVMVMEMHSVATIAWSRFVVAFFFLSLFFLIKRPAAFKIIKNPPWKLLIAGVMLGINYYGFNAGIKYTTPSNAQVFIQSGPLLLAMAGIFIFKEKLSLLQIVGFLIAITGFSLFYSEQVSFNWDQNYSLGILFLLMGGTSWAIYAIFQKQLVRTFHPQEINLLIYGIPAVLYIPLVDFNQYMGLTPGYWILLIALGLNTLVAYGCLSMALKHLEANRVSIIVTVNPVITFVTMAILGEMNVDWIKSEHFTTITIIGALMVLIGAIIVISLRKKKNKKYNNRNF